MSIHMHEFAWRNKKKVLESLELDLHVLLVLGIPEKITHFLKGWAIFSPASHWSITFPCVSISYIMHINKHIVCIFTNIVTILCIYTDIVTILCIYTSIVTILCIYNNIVTLTFSCVYFYIYSFSKWNMQYFSSHFGYIKKMKVLGFLTLSSKRKKTK